MGLYLDSMKRVGNYFLKIKLLYLAVLEDKPETCSCFTGPTRNKVWLAANLVLFWQCLENYFCLRCLKKQKHILTRHFTTCMALRNELLSSSVDPCQSWFLSQFTEFFVVCFFASNSTLLFMPDLSANLCHGWHFSVQGWKKMFSCWAPKLQPFYAHAVWNPLGSATFI